MTGREELTTLRILSRCRNQRFISATLVAFIIHPGPVLVAHLGSALKRNDNMVLDDTAPLRRQHLSCRCKVAAVILVRNAVWGGKDWKKKKKIIAGHEFYKTGSDIISLSLPNALKMLAKGVRRHEIFCQRYFL
jgi:uncharacterized protein (UPF0264 family)